MGAGPECAGGDTKMRQATASYKDWYPSFLPILIKKTVHNCAPYVDSLAIGKISESADSLLVCIFSAARGRLTCSILCYGFLHHVPRPLCEG